MRAGRRRRRRKAGKSVKGKIIGGVKMRPLNRNLHLNVKTPKSAFDIGDEMFDE